MDERLENECAEIVCDWAKHHADAVLQSLSVQTVRRGILALDRQRIKWSPPENNVRKGMKVEDLAVAWMLTSRLQETKARLQSIGEADGVKIETISTAGPHPDSTWMECRGDRDTFPAFHDALLYFYKSRIDDTEKRLRELGVEV